MSLRVIGPDSQRTPRTPLTVITGTTTSRGHVDRYVASPKTTTTVSRGRRRINSLDFLTSPGAEGRADLSTRAQRYSPAAADICKTQSRCSSSQSTTDIIKEVEDLCLVGSDSIVALSSPRYLFPSDRPEEFELNPITPFQREEDPLEVDPFDLSPSHQSGANPTDIVHHPGDNAGIIGLESTVNGNGDDHESSLLEMYVRRETLSLCL